MIRCGKILRWQNQEANSRHVSVPFNRKSRVTDEPTGRLTFESRRGIEQLESKNLKKPVMAVKATTNFADLIHKVTASCLIHPLTRPHLHETNEPESLSDSENLEFHDDSDSDLEEEEQTYRELGHKKLGQNHEEENSKLLQRVKNVETLLSEVFGAVGALKLAYVSMQAAHSPWDPQGVRNADVGVVVELRRLAALRERFRRGGGAPQPPAVVAPYEAVVEDFKREVREREAEVAELKERLRHLGGGGGDRMKKMKRMPSARGEVAAAPSFELFESCMNQVKHSSKSFAALLLSLMRAAHWDIAAAVRSITGGATTLSTASARLAVESYVCCKMFQGFENESFYISGMLSCLLEPEKHRQDCFAQFKAMLSLDPPELLSLLSESLFGKFSAKKYMKIVHPKMEEAFFGGLEQRRMVASGKHPKTEFYSEFLVLAKAVWMLHRLAFAMEPLPSQFRASRGAEFHPEFMESVGGIPGGVSGGLVSFSVTPGFKIGGFVIKARVCLVSRK
ncbi:hypothetical protein AMTRI_Chr08g160270 [Amborella trichopoda]